MRDSFAAAVQQLRATGTVPANLPRGLSQILNPVTALYVSQVDRYDPAQAPRSTTSSAVSPRLGRRPRSCT